MNKQSEDIRVIREMMERSSKFLSLSGKAGIAVGVIALCGVGYVHCILLPNFAVEGVCAASDLLPLLTVGLSVLLLSAVTGVYFSHSKAKATKQKVSTAVRRRTLYNLAIPMVAGGIVSVVLLLRGEVSLAIALTLLFYGLALINVSKFTYEEVHHLGVAELFLGVMAAIFIDKVMWFWAIGFGLLHIIYGVAMYLKYERK